MEKILSLSSDNAANMILAILTLKRSDLLFEDLIHVRCANHIINLVVQIGLAQKELGNLTAKIRYFCKKIHCGSKLRAELKAQQIANKEPIISIVMDVEIRWNSTHDMLSSALRIRKSLTTISKDLEETNESDGTKSSITLHDWINAELVVNLLEPFYQSINQYCSAYVKLYFVKILIYKVQLTCLEKITHHALKCF